MNSQSQILLGESLLLDFHQESGGLDDSQSGLNQKACKVASRTHREILFQSNFITAKNLGSITKIVQKDVMIDKVKWNSQFCDWIQITTYKLPSPRKYTLKRVKTCQSDRDYCQGASELAREVLYLTNLDHPHIVALKAVSIEGPSGYETGEGCFLVSELIVETLEQRFCQWQQYPDTSTFLSRMEICCSIGSALSYLHSRNIIYRDLRCANIGYTLNGSVKITEMGCARELCGEVNLSPRGTIPYIAPEVITNRPYNLSADVYSMSILVWQLLSLKSGNFGSKEEYIQSTCFKSSRPQVPSDWSDTLRLLLNCGWMQNPRNRPSMRQLKYWIEQEVYMLKSSMGIPTKPEPKPLETSLLRQGSTGKSLGHTTPRAYRSNRSLVGGSMKSIQQRSNRSISSSNLPPSNRSARSLSPRRLMKDSSNKSIMSHSSKAFEYPNGICKQDSINSIGAFSFDKLGSSRTLVKDASSSSLVIEKQESLRRIDKQLSSRSSDMVRTLEKQDSVRRQGTIHPKAKLSPSSSRSARGLISS